MGSRSESRTSRGPFLHWSSLRLSAAGVVANAARAAPTGGTTGTRGIGLAAGPGLPGAFSSALRGRNVGAQRRVNTRAEKPHL